MIFDHKIITQLVVYKSNGTKRNKSDRHCLLRLKHANYFYHAKKSISDSKEDDKTVASYLMRGIRMSLVVISVPDVLFGIGEVSRSWL